MRERLSNLISEFAKRDPRAIVLSGDHGYALFDEIRRNCSSQFINVGVMEQAMVGMAAGLAKTGALPIVYGLSAFVPIRVLEQIKLDVCYSNLPVIFLGDGAGLVYTTLGSSHQCAEDIAALRPMPNIQIYSPADEQELVVCFNEAIASKAPCYIRIGKSDRPVVHSKPLASTEPVRLHEASKKVCLVSSGSMTSIAQEAAKRFKLSHYCLPRLKPFPREWVKSILPDFERVIVIEEHSRFGGVCSALMDAACEAGIRPPLMTSLSLQDKFADKCGSYQYALSEHGMNDEQILSRVQVLVEGS
ncbi:MAG: transketolase C-terminal domain-containing protein [Bdellovibrionota bacterium]